MPEGHLNLIWPSVARGTLYDMKILKHGTKKAKQMRGTCGHCGCRVQCSEEETSKDQERPGADVDHYVQCPQCKADYLWLR